MRKIIVTLFLLFQVGMIINARFTEARYFCWAPYDAHSKYRIDVNVDGDMLPQEKVRMRYRLYTYGVDRRSIMHVKNIIKQYESTYGKDDHAQATLIYSTNGKEKEFWAWPPR